MDRALFIVAGVIAGGAVAWFWASTRWKTTLATERVEAQGKIKGSEGTINELRAQVQRSNDDATSLRQRLSAEEKARVVSETRLEETERGLEEEKQLLQQGKAKLTDSFAALSAAALKSNNEAFIELAKSAFATVQEQARGDLEKRQQAIQSLVSPLEQSLARYEGQVKEIEKARQQAYDDLQNEIKNLSAANKKLETETGNLTVALKGGPQVRGRWGEMTLRRVVELAGMSEHCDFKEQETLFAESGRLRPDMIVNLPGGRRIAVDAKAPLQAFLDAADAASDEERQACLGRHGGLVRAHLNQLATKAYWEQLQPMPDVVVLFLPGESFFSAALKQDATLFEDGMEKRVLVATPTTLFALLRAVAYGWRQQQIQENAQQVGEIGKEIYDRLRTFAQHFVGAGSSLKRAVQDYNKAVGSLESRF
ncbi:MAG TPA: DNA recombination protein RmuC [Terriglobia bacterium]|nr:DNA recombination protein RmuC [Terriglobia bacterium]